MNSPVPISWKEIAWNGIRFLAPDDWNVGKIGNRYLMLEDASEPVLEIKWGQIQGRFSHQKHLRRLAALHGGRLHKTIREVPLPVEWKKPLKNFQTAGFTWSGKTVGGRGVIIYCPVCRTATLIQFYLSGTSPPSAVHRRLLASFRDHRHDERQLWSLYDIRAIVPAKFKLARYQFAPGHFELYFASKNKTILLSRWGLAAILLSDKTLLQFAEAMDQIPKTKLKPEITSSPRIVEGRVSRTPEGWFHLIHRISLKPAYYMFRLWHLEEKNRILAVRTEGRNPIASQFFHDICAGYETL